MNEKHPIKIGVICLARKTFDFAAAAEIYRDLQKKLYEIEAIQWEFIPELVIEVDESQKAAHLLKQKEIDGLICISGTFALGHLILEVNKVLHLPIALWALNELPYDGGKIRLNSLCGVNLNASNLYKAGVKNVHVVIGEDLQELNPWLDAIRIKAIFHSAHVGLIGYRAQGFFNLDVDELDLYNKTGVLIDHYELADLFAIEVSEEIVETRKNQLSAIFDVSTLTSEKLNKVALLSAKFNRFMQTHNLTNLAIRCWPEFARMFGISPCAAMSLLQSEGKILSCEGDILGSLSQLAHQAIGGETPFLADFSQANFQEDFALLWHCGVAACNLWDGQCNRSLDTYFAGGKGVTADFVMKSGPISLARIDYSPGEYRILIQQGEGIPMEKELKGTYLKTTFTGGVRPFFDKIIKNGIAHHISLVYGDFTHPFRIFGKLMNWEIIE